MTESVSKRYNNLSEKKQALLDAMLKDSAVSERYNNLSEKKQALLNAMLNKQQPEQESSFRRKKNNHQQKEQQNHAGEYPGLRPSPLITMRSSGSKIPFFFVHALFGSAYHYHHLANMMEKDQPFYALQCPGLDGNEQPLNNIKDFAALYIQAIRSVQPKGPYKLGGYSFGGWVAFEMARQLSSQGEETELLAICGSGVPLSVSNPFLFTIMEYSVQYLRDFRQNIVQPFFSSEQRIAMGSGRTKMNLPLFRIVSAHNMAALRFLPKPYHGKITLFETVEQQIFSPFDSSGGWGRLTTQKVETHLVSGNHLSMLDEPHIKELAEKLTICLNK